MKRNPIAMLNSIAQMIYDKKGFNILALDVQGLSTITDYLLIAEGNVDRHVIAMARGIVEEMGESGEKPIHTEGLQTGDWIVLDYGQVMIHLFTSGLRDRYSLERLWPDSKLVELDITTRSSINS
jgi:ribosome-associated protein